MRQDASGQVAGARQVGGKRRGLKRKIRDAPTEDDAMTILLDASLQEHKLRKRVRVAAALEEALLGELFEPDVQPDVQCAAVEAQRLTGERFEAEVPTTVEVKIGSGECSAASADKAFHDDIMDLLELAESGFPVIWPRGWDIQRARSTQSHTREL